MSSFIVNGGGKLGGVYEVSGAKNAGPKLIIAAMLSDKEGLLRNIPRISDTEKIMSAIRQMGGECSWSGDHEVKVNCANLKDPHVPDVVLTARHAVLFIGATLARLGKLRIEKIGGDKIGKRPIDRLLGGLESLGAQVIEKNGVLEMSMPERLASRDYTFAKNTHTGTESLILGSIFNSGIVTIRNAAEEPEVDNLIEFTNAMGAKVRRIDPRVIEITGVPKLLGAATGKSMYDRLEAATALALNVMNGGGIEVRNVDPKMVKFFTDALEQIGASEPSTKYLVPVTLKTAVHPGFITDLQPIMSLLLAYKGGGRSEIHEMIYEQRWSALQELAKMGVKYELFQPAGYTANDFNFNEREFHKNDPYGAYVWGPTELRAAEVESRDVRAGITVLIAALFAQGESKINDPDNHIDRGYEDIVGKLQRLGADIRRIDSPLRQGYAGQA